MECRANNAEREAELLKEQLKHLKGQLDEVWVSNLLIVDFHCFFKNVQ